MSSPFQRVTEPAAHCYGSANKPRRKAVVVSSDNANENSRDSSRGAQAWPERVLIVDDNRDTTMTLGILLRSEGYIITLATTGSEAIALAELRAPDVALVDLHMPGKSGFDVASELQRRHGTGC